MRLIRGAPGFTLAVMSFAATFWLGLWISPLGLRVWHDHIYSDENGPTLVAGCIYATGSGFVERFYYRGEGCAPFAWASYEPRDEEFDDEKLPLAP